MIDYLSSFTNTNGSSFPDTLGVNASGPTATDGTEFVKLFIDDIWGARQALMSEAGLTPDSVSEAPGTSQMVEAMRILFGGAGEVVQYMKNTDPSVNGDRILLLNGQGVLRANYTDLDTAVYVGDGNNGTASAFYHADDAAGTSRNTAGVYLILPETRGYVPRGLDTAASVDPDGASRDLGNNQADAMMRITGETGGASLIGNSPGLAPLGVFSSTTTGSAAGRSSGGTNNVNIIFDSANSTSPNTAKTNDVETRGANYATVFGIRY